MGMSPKDKLYAAGIGEFLVSSKDFNTEFDYRDCS